MSKKETIYIRIQEEGYEAYSDRSLSNKIDSCSYQEGFEFITKLKKTCNILIDSNLTKFALLERKGITNEKKEANKLLHLIKSRHSYSFKILRINPRLDLAVFYPRVKTLGFSFKEEAMLWKPSKIIKDNSRIALEYINKYVVIDLDVSKISYKDSYEKEELKLRKRLDLKTLKYTLGTFILIALVLGFFLSSNMLNNKKTERKHLEINNQSYQKIEKHDYSKVRLIGVIINALDYDFTLDYNESSVKVSINLSYESVDKLWSILDSRFYYNVLGYKKLEDMVVIIIEVFGENHET